MLKRERSILVCSFTVLAGILVCWNIAGAGKTQPPPPPEYSLTQLKILQGYTASNGIHMNDNGQVVGCLKTASGGQCAAVWETPSATPTVLPLPEGYDQSWANAINNHGQIAGWAGVVALGPGHPVIWVPGENGYEMWDLIGNSADDGGASDINEDGVVVGSFSNWESAEPAFVICPADTDGDGVPDSWFLDDNGDGVNDLMLGLRGAYDGGWFTVEPSAINDSGWVVGLWDPGDPAGFYPFLIIPDYTLPNPWFADDDGDGTNDLAIFLPVGREALDVNNQGQIAIYGPVVLQTVVAEDGTVSFTQTQLPPTTTYSWYYPCINDNGQVAGMGHPLKHGANPDNDPLLWQADKGTRSLESLSNMAGFSDLTAAESINNLGQIVGSGTTSSGQRGYVATPVPK
jgi:uncharacterized membrane protein